MFYYASPHGPKRIAKNHKNVENKKQEHKKAGKSGGDVAGEVEAAEAVNQFQQISTMHDAVTFFFFNTM